MGATIQSYLRGYNDPRVYIYFQNSGKKAVRAGLPVTQKLYDDASLPKITEDSPVYWMKASEVSFLCAEGALANFNMGGTAKHFYEEGIRKSFEENKVSDLNDELDEYLSSIAQPQAYVDPVNSAYNAASPSTITVAWSESDDVEKKLERIITQKYLAIFPDGQEAWTEWRRTGYPRQITPVKNLTNAGVITTDGYKNGVRRMPYPRNEYDRNGENLQKAVQQYLGGADNASVNVWWDKKEKN